MRLIVIAGDQLSLSLSALRDKTADDVVLLAEVFAESQYVQHHQQKLVLFFSAMRHFAKALQQAGWQVHYIQLEDGVADLTSAVAATIKAYPTIQQIVLTELGEYRLAQQIDTWSDRFQLAVEVRPDDRFIVSKNEFAQWAQHRKTLRMEHFYRQMRRHTQLLMDGDQPIGGQWNYDADNRAACPADLAVPPPLLFAPDDITQSVIALVKQQFSQHIGDAAAFQFAVTSKDAKAAFLHFVRTQLPLFGRYQDAMRTDQPFLFHSLCALYLNCGLLDARWVCLQVQQAYQQGEVPLSSAEGFIRQIIGWREYVRGIYWWQMPHYRERNYFAATRPLPGYFWTGQTHMFCMAQAIGQTIQYAYAHHIQRLMITGNFALLTGLSVDEVTDWYLAVYADAIEWVELPNTLGMALYADGGLLASKPYVASGNYIHKMSDYCQHCKYHVKETLGANACPFNALYWDFLARHQDTLGTNPRLALPYLQWQRKSAIQQQHIREKAAELLLNLSAL